MVLSKETADRLFGRGGVKIADSVIDTIHNHLVALPSGQFNQLVSDLKRLFALADLFKQEKG